MTYNGYNGDIEIDGEALTITRSGFVARVAFGKDVESRVIPLRAISGVRLETASLLTNGWLQLLVGGDDAPELSGGTAASNGDTVLFTYNNRKGFEQLHKQLESVVTANAAEGVDPSTVAVTGKGGQVGRFDAHAAKWQEKVDRNNEAVEEASAAEEAWYQGVAMVGTRPNGKAHRAIVDHADTDEKPWLLIGSGAAGVLAAFEDRLLIVKTGAMTSLISGSFGGGRITTFPYAEITGIEYNSGLMSGVLEVLTASYQGSVNKDYWRGRTKSRNADSNDPWTLSNCLPLSKALYQKATPHLGGLRKRMAAAKQVTVQVTTPAAPAAAGLGDELRKLAELRDQGVLSDEEFTAAKQAVITRST